MKDISFFSEDKYLYLPSTKNPKVILAIGNRVKAKYAFKLYNPFSFKAKLLKYLSQFICINLNNLAKNLILVKPEKKSGFITYLEEVLKTKLTTSIYYATEKDKVVLQLLSDNSVFGYLKFPLNEAGIANINVEKKAISILSERNIIEPQIMFSSYEETPFLVLKELKGSIGSISHPNLELILKKFKKDESHKLINHPRIIDLHKQLEILGNEKYKQIVASILKTANKKYYEAFEHGDFAPWNIIKTSEEFVPFDFEFFVENGIEYFDLIKYHFQVGRLLKKKKEEELLNYISENIKISELNKLVVLFLIKEMVLLRKLKQSYQFQENMLNIIYE